MLQVGVSAGGGALGQLGRQCARQKSAVAAAVGGLLLVVLVVSVASGDASPPPPPPPPPTHGGGPAPNPPTRVMFSGNSFTYGPSARLDGQPMPDQGPLNNLPRIFTLVAHSLGVPVVTGEDTIGGCTAIAHTLCNNNNPQTLQPQPAAGVGAPAGCERVMLKLGAESSRGYHEYDWDSPGGPFDASGRSCASNNTCTADATHVGKGGAGFPRLTDGTTPSIGPFTAGPMTPFLPPSLAAHCAIPCASQNSRTAAGNCGSQAGGGNDSCVSSVSSGRATYHPCPQVGLAPFYLGRAFPVPL